MLATGVLSYIGTPYSLLITAGDGEFTDTMTMQVFIADVNESPSFPSVTLHIACAEHVLEDATQKKPVDASQSVVPHVHSPSLVDIPVATTHAFDDVIVIVSMSQ